MKINLAIDCIDDHALSTLITLYSFLEKNKWFNGKVYIIIPNNSSLTQNARANLTSIYSNLEVINCSATSAFRNHILNHESDLLAIQKILAVSSLFIAEERMLFVSSGCVFFKAISSILNSNPISLSTDSSGNIAGEIFYRKIIISDTLVTDTKLVEFFSSKEDISKILSSEFNVNSTAVFGEKSSRFNDRVFMKMKSSISPLYFIKYDTLQRDARQFTKINQIFLQNKNQVTNKLKRPIFRNGKTIIKSKSPIFPVIPEEPNTSLNVNQSANNSFQINKKSQNIGLSIIIPAFGASRYIEECLNSIVAQSHKKIEILIGIDNCKSTLSKLNEVKHKYENLKIFFSDTSAGPYIIRNSLVDFCTYENILFFDADDIMGKDLISKLLPHFHGKFIVRFKYMNFNDGTDPLSSGKLHSDIAHGVFFITKEIFKKIGGFQAWKMGADSEFIKRSVMNKFRTVNINSSLFYRRVHSNSLTQHSSTNHKSSERIRLRNWIKTNRNWKIPITTAITKLDQIK